MPAFAILRLAKVKTLASLDRRSRHCARTQPVANADGSGDIAWLTAAQDPAGAVKAVLDGLDRPPRRNAVLAVELIATASPEWFAGGGDRDRIGRAVLAWSEATFGPGRVAAAVRHDDEKTSHIHLFLVPWVDSPAARRGRKRKDGQPVEAQPCRRLDWAGLIGTDRTALSRLQDGFAAALAPLGLERGQRRSLAAHTELSVWRGRQVGAAVAEARTIQAAAALTEAAAKGT